MMKTLVKGNEAVVIGALVAGCDAYFGYPITPASEIAHKASEYFLKLNKIFIQAECEVGAINMVYGAASSGLRVMTASSGPGISLKQEGVSYLAGANLPAVIVDVMRVGPGLGNIGPEQGDYNQVVKGGGHGNYHAIVLAPNSVAEMYSLTIRAFELADQYRTPVYLLADATIGQMMEPIDVQKVESRSFEKPWRADATPETNENLITSIYLDFDDMEAHVQRLNQKYEEIAQQEADAETWRTEDAELVVTGYGIVSRLLHTVVDSLRAEGKKVGMIRPKTLWPFPTRCYQENVPDGAKVLAVELSTGQFVDDVRLALPHHSVAFYGRVGGNVPTLEQIREQILQQLGADN
ncbi:MAG: 3-methyl-2-oxobutanoate dehydrogenase subunit VorB [Planctomycetia bacterium]|nr:3-methyl-2-oxobutanoate dehydrogenase subunit VorB [Planctomycetia bacterium]